MTREFIILKEFDKKWKSFGLKEDDLRDLQLFLIETPDVGKIIKGTGGLRKFRWALPGQGKSGGARVLYVDLIIKKKIYLVTIFPKNEKENISEEDKNLMKKLIQSLEKEA